MSMPIAPVTFTSSLALLGVVARKYVVPEGYVMPVRSGGRHRRLMWPGANVLGPGEEAGEPIDTRAHDVVLDVPNVVLHNGLPVTVHLRYMLCLLPKEMAPATLYWDAAQREALQIQILSDCLQHAIAETTRPIVQEAPDCISLQTIFSPFVGASLDMLCRKTQERGRKQLTEHAMRMLAKTFVVENVSLPPALVEAYHDFERAGFDSAAGFVFMQRLLKIAPDMADSCVMRLQSAICYEAPAIRDILHEGRFCPSAFAKVADVLIKVPAGQVLTHPAATREPQVASVAVAHQPIAAAAQEYPLTPEVMALLKAL